MTNSLAVPRKDQVQLELPASPQYGRVGRIAAAHLGLRRGFSLHEIDDLRLVMDEAAVMLLGPGLLGDRLEITYTIEDNVLHVDARVASEADVALPVERIDRFDELVGELVDHYEIDAAARRLTFSKGRGSSQ